MKWSTSRPRHRARPAAGPDRFPRRRRMPVPSIPAISSLVPAPLVPTLLEPSVTGPPGHPRSRRSSARSAAVSLSSSYEIGVASCFSGAEPDGRRGAGPGSRNSVSAPPSLIDLGRRPPGPGPSRPLPAGPRCRSPRGRADRVRVVRIAVRELGPVHSLKSKSVFVDSLAPKCGLRAEATPARVGPTTPTHLRGSPLSLWRPDRS
jgi:hypothetical protein